MTENQRRVLETLIFLGAYEHAPVTSGEVAEAAVGLTPALVGANLAVLRQKGYVRTIRAGHPSLWALTDKHTR